MSVNCGDKVRLVFIADPYEVGGSIEIFINLLEELRKNNDLSIVVLSSKYGRCNQYADSVGIENYAVGHTSYYVNRGSTVLRVIIRKLLYPYLCLEHYLRNIQALKKAEDRIDFTTVDIIHSNTINIDIGALIAKKYNIPHIWHIRVFGELDYGCFSLRKNYIDFINSHSSCLVAISEAVSKHWISKGLIDRKIRVIYDGVPYEQFSTNIREKRNDKIKLVIAGFVSPFKGQIQIIKALSKMDKQDRKKFELDIYGHGAIEYIAFLKWLIMLHGLDENIHFIGHVNNLKQLLSNYDIGLTCSKSEGFGLVTIEYMMAGLPVIASNTGANPEIVKDGENGYLYKFDDIDDLKNKILLVGQEIQSQEKNYSNNIDYVHNRFNIKRNAMEVCEIYNIIRERKDEI